MRWILRSKIHKATVTEANIDYIGSITIDEDLVDRVGLMIGEKVLVVSNTSGARLETYVIRGERGSGVICINGAAAHLIKKGEEVIVIGFELSDTPIDPTPSPISPQPSAPAPALATHPLLRQGDLSWRNFMDSGGGHAFSTLKIDVCRDPSGLTMRRARCSRRGRTG